MTQRLKPTWEELRVNNLLSIYGQECVLTTQRLSGYIKYLNSIRVEYEIPFSLRGKTFITKGEYESIRVRELKLESYTGGEDDIIDPIVVRSFRN